MNAGSDEKWDNQGFSKFKVGDVATLNSGGPGGTVTAVYKEDGKVEVLFSTMERLERITISENCFQKA